jgi:hypothetical protein
MKKSWNIPLVLTYGNVTRITTQTTATCPTSEKKFGSSDGFIIGPVAIGCS